MTKINEWYSLHENMNFSVAVVVKNSLPCGTATMMQGQAIFTPKEFPTSIIDLLKR